MNVSLTPQLEEFVAYKVSSGRYSGASEVVREALRLLEEQDRLREIRLDHLRREVAIGLEQIERGQVVDGKQFFDELLRKLEARAAGKP